MAIEEQALDCELQRAAQSECSILAEVWEGPRDIKKGNSRSHGCSRMGTRENYKSLSQAKRGEFVAALLSLKAQGVFDRFVQWHLDAMAHSTPPVGAGFGASRRNAAHREPAFLPWHREYLR